jgi:iron complex outermembrane receptor protein
VLAGPQGTLFGKNSSAGVVSIRTKKPNMEEFEGRFKVNVADDNESGMELSLTGPISDTLGYRLFLFDRQADGVATNVFDGSDENGIEAQGLKAKLQWEPSDKLTLLFTGDYSEKESNCCAMAPHATDGGQGSANARFNLVTGDFDPVNGFAVTTPEWLGVEADQFGTQISSDVQQINEQRNWGGALEANYDFDNEFTLTSITAYREWTSYTSRDRDSSFAQLSGLNPQEVAWMMGTATFGTQATRAQIDNAMTELGALSYNSIGFMTNSDGTLGTNNSTEFNETFSQEFRITSPLGEHFDYIAGMYFSNQKVQRDLTIAGKWNRNGGAIADNPITNINPLTGAVTCVDASCYKFGDTITSVETENKSIYGHLNFHLTEDLTLFAGARYIDEDSTWDMLNAVGPYGNHFSFLGLIESVPYMDQLAAAADGGDATALSRLSAITGFADTATYRANSHVANSQDALAAVNGRSTQGGQGTLAFTKKYADTASIYKVGAQYNINQNMMLYASYGTGYKSPAVNADIFIFDELGDILTAPTKPEESTGFEIGLKGSFDSWRFDLTYYDTDIEGLHTDGSATGGGARAVGRLVAGDVNTSGVEGNFTWAATDALTLTGGFSAGSAEIDDASVTVGGASANGTTILLAPELKYNVSADYRFDLGEYQAGVLWTYTYTDETYYGFGEQQPRDAFAISNIAFNIGSQDEVWNVSVYVKNLFDEEYNSSLRSVSSTQGGGAMHTVGRDAERYMGASFTRNF